MFLLGYFLDSFLDLHHVCLRSTACGFTMRIFLLSPDACAMGKTCIINVMKIIFKSMISIGCYAFVGTSGNYFPVLDWTLNVVKLSRLRKNIFVHLKHP